MKNGLLFVQEVFAEKRAEEVGGFVKLVLPSVLLKTVFEKNFIVIEAKKAMASSVKNCLFPQTIDALVEGCNSKNGSMAELSIAYLAELVKNFEPGFFLECGPTVEGLFKQLNVEVDGKRMKMKKTAEEILRDLK